MPGDSVIEVNSLVKKYGDKTAVNGISFEVNHGKIFAFCGPNGAGKTTTVEILECLRSPTSGNAKILGLDISRSGDVREIRKRIGVLPQDFNTFDLLTVKETLDFFSKIYDPHLDVKELIKMIDMEEYNNVLYKNLSGGLKQRVGVAIALANDPEVVFLDEPTTGLDPKARRDVWDVITGLKNKGKTVFLTTHYMGEVESLADNVSLIYDGKIIAEGTPQQMISKYGGNQTMVLEGGGEKVQRTLKKLIDDVILDKNGDVLVKINNRKEIYDVVRALESENVEYDRLSIKGATFDDVFLNLTGKKIVDGKLQ